MLNNQVIVITGGSDGLGKVMALRLSKNNQVVIIARNEDKLKATASEAGCEYEVADISDWGSISAAIENVIKKFDHIDVLVNNAAVWIQGALAENDPGKITQAIEINLLGQMLTTRATLPFMKEKGRGTLFFTNSQAGFYHKAERSVYNAGKWALTGFSRSLADELAAEGIRVMSLFPSLIGTAMFDKVDIQKDMKASIAPEYLAEVVEFMLSAPDGVTFPEVGVKNINYGK